MRVAATKPDFDKIDWESLGIDDESVLTNIKAILDKPAQINSIMLELYQLGLKQKQIGHVFGVSESTVSLRIAGKVGTGEGLAQKPKNQMAQYIHAQEARNVCPHSEFLEETLIRFRISPRKTEDIMFLYTESYPDYDFPDALFQLLRANRVSEKKAKLIMQRFFLETIIPEVIDFPVG